MKRQQLSGARNFLYSGAENCESAAPGLPQIPPQGPPPGRRALRRTAAPGKKTWRGRHGQHCQQRNPQCCEVPTEHSFPGELPDLRRLALVLEALPDEALPARLQERRGRYPVRAAGDHRRASARAVSGSGAQPQRTLCGFSPLDCQDKPKVDNDGKPRVTSPEPRSTVPGSHNFSRFLRSLIKLESKEPWVDGMVRQLREQGRVAGLRRAPRLRRQGRGQSRDRPVARPARPPTPTGESTRRLASTGRPAI